MNKYKTWYNNIINRAHNRVIEGYTELHHIIPRSLGGSDDINNLVTLTAREHFICHILLTKFTTGQDRNKMLHAAILMKSTNRYQDRYFNSRLYETVRRDYSVAASERQLGELNHFYGKKHTDETREKMSAAKKGTYIPWNKGIARTEKEKRNISLALKGQPSPKKGILQGPLTEEQKQRHKEALQGKCFWWTDGIKNIRSATCPNGYKKGRTMSPSHLASFTHKE